MKTAEGFLAPRLADEGPPPGAAACAGSGDDGALGVAPAAVTDTNSSAAAVAGPIVGPVLRTLPIPRSAAGALTLG